uniref:E3 ubiquitin-protein ligase n=1 Tax=Megaselia scalaris TaxID=36166 RepID=T1GET4_MEGSC
MHTFYYESIDKFVENNVLRFKKNPQSLNICRRASCILSDVRYILNFKPETWTDELRDGFMDGCKVLVKLLGVMQGMESVTRQTGQHMDYEPEWESAFNLHIKLAGVISLILDWCATDREVLTKLYALVAKKTVEKNIFLKKIDISEKKLAGHVARCNIYDVASKPVSIHLPVSRMFAGLYVLLGKFGLCYDNAPFTSTLNINRLSEEIIEPILCTQTMCAQVQAGMWRRNGYSLVGGGSAQSKFMSSNAEMFMDCEEEAQYSDNLDIEGAAAYNSTACLGFHRRFQQPEDPKFKCILCFEDAILHKDKPVLVYPAFIQKSKIIYPLAENKAVDNIEDCAPPSPHTSTCGHVMHGICWKEYFDNEVLKENRRLNRTRPPKNFQAEKREFLCPYCRCLSNAVLPLIPPQQNESNQFEENETMSFDNWLSVMHDFLNELYILEQKTVENAGVAFANTPIECEFPKLSKILEHCGLEVASMLTLCHPKDKLESALSLSKGKNSSSESKIITSRMKERCEIAFRAILTYSVKFLEIEADASLECLDNDNQSDESDEGQYCTVLYNDEGHTFEQVIQTLTRIIKCQQKDAMEIVTSIDRDGRAVAKCGTFEQCRQLQEQIEKQPMQYTSSIPRMQPLKVTVLHKRAVSCQQFALQLLTWFQDFLTRHSAFRAVFAKVIGDKTARSYNIAHILEYDSKLWKNARS